MRVSITELNRGACLHSTIDHKKILFYSLGIPYRLNFHWSSLSSSQETFQRIDTNTHTAYLESSLSLSPVRAKKSS